MPFLLYLSQPGASVTHTKDELCRYSGFTLSDYVGEKLAKE